MFKWKLFCYFISNVSELCTPEKYRKIYINEHSGMIPQHNFEYLVIVTADEKKIVKIV